MKYGKGLPKQKIFKDLKALGLTVSRRVNDQGYRVWVTSDGKEYNGLRELCEAKKIEL